MYNIARLRHEMEQQFLTVSELARRAGMKMPTVSKILTRGTGQPHNIKKLAQALDIDPSELVNRGGSE